jgi:hypothetical protein
MIGLNAQDKPVAFADSGVLNWIADQQFMREAELFTQPPQRTWVGLTDEEITTTSKETHFEPKPVAAFARAIEAKLKEKNT